MWAILPTGEPALCPPMPCAFVTVIIKSPSLTSHVPWYVTRALLRPIIVEKLPSREMVLLKTAGSFPLEVAICRDHVPVIWRPSLLS